MSDPHNPRRPQDDPATRPRPHGPGADTGELPPDIEPHRPPQRTPERPPNADPEPGRDSRRNRSV